MRLEGSLLNRIGEQATPKTPEVGIGATLLYYTDRTACTIIEVSPRQIILQEDICTRNDGNPVMCDVQSYSYAPNPEGRKYVAKLRHRGGREFWETYVSKERRNQGNAPVSGVVVFIGDRNHYYDYGF